MSIQSIIPNYWQVKYFKWKKTYLPTGSIRHSIASGSFWILIGSVFSRGFAVIGSIILARILGKMNYGKWAIILSGMAMFAQFSGFGFSTTLTRYIAMYKDTDISKTGKSLTFCMLFGMSSIFLMSMACFVASHFMANKLYASIDLATPLAISSILLFFMMGTQLLQGALVGFNDFKSLSATNVTQGIFIIFLTVPLTKLYALNGIVIGTALTWTLAMVIALIRVRKNCMKYHICFPAKGFLKEYKILWQFGLPNLFTGGFVSVATGLSLSFVAKVQEGFSQLGGYGAATQWKRFVSFVPQNIRKITLPMLAQLRYQEDGKKRFVKVLWAMVVLNGGIALIAAIPVMILSYWILGFYGAEFQQDWDILVVLVGSCVFQAINDVVTQVTSTLKKMWSNFFIHIVYSLILLGGTALLVNQFGVRGYVWAFTAATFSHMCINFCAAIFWIKKESFWKEQTKRQLGFSK